jgi:CBS domain containing-hemolysin-like protein
MQGLATMEDIIETILGLEIMDEKDIAVNMQELAKKKWEVRKKNLNIDKDKTKGGSSNPSS